MKVALCTLNLENKALHDEECKFKLIAVYSLCLYEQNMKQSN